MPVYPGQAPTSGTARVEKGTLTAVALTTSYFVPFMAQMPDTNYDIGIWVSGLMIQPASVTKQKTGFTLNLIAAVVGTVSWIAAK